MPEHCDKDNGIFAQLYDAHATNLRYYLQSRLASDDIEDAIQDAFLRLHDRMNDETKQPIEREKLVPYLYTIVKNSVRDQYRRNMRAIQIETGIDDAFLQNIPDTAPSPEAVYDAKELREALDTAVATLPEKMAEAVRSLLAGKTFEIAAHEFGIQIPALKYRLRKAKSLLKNIL
jgi:RNA polymerase sigma factor (sigma-70 family)